MGFLDANVDNRHRALVRGRVIVATTSRVVEYLEESLKYSYPLYSVTTIPDGYLLVFCVELNGYLTFDRDSVVRISPEMPGVGYFCYEPTAFALVKTADPVAVIPPYQGKITGVPPPVARYDDDIGDYTIDRGTVFYEKSPGVIATAVFTFPGQQDGGPGRAYFTDVFKVGDIYKGDNGYPNFKRIN